MWGVHFRLIKYYDIVIKIEMKKKIKDIPVPLYH